MKAILFLILIIFITCGRDSYLYASKEERIERQKQVKAKLIKCIKENASPEFIKFVNENEAELRKAIAMNKDKLKKEDLLVIRKCRLDLIKEKNNEEIKKENSL